MIELYTTEAAAFSPYREKALDYVTPSRREKALHIREEGEFLRSLSAGVLLRAVLGDEEPRLSPEGKPYLPGGPAFSLSHGGELTVLAVDRSKKSAALGVDAEKKDRPWRQAVADRVFQSGELRFLAEGGGERFLYLWTRKEALTKCTGQGLRAPMRDFSVLEDRCIYAGQTFYLRTEEIDGHYLSVAALRDEPTLLRRLSPEECLAMAEKG